MSSSLFAVLATAAITGAPFLAYIAWRKAPTERASLVVDTIATVNEDLRKQLALRDQEVERCHAQLRQQATDAQADAARIRREAQDKIESLQQRVAVLERMYEEVVSRNALADRREVARDHREVKRDERELARDEREAERGD